MGPTPLLANYQTTHQIKDNVSPDVNMGREQMMMMILLMATPMMMTATTVMMTQDCIVSPLNLTVTEGGGIGAGWGQKWIGPLEPNDIKMQSEYFDRIFRHILIMHLSQVL